MFCFVTGGRKVVNKAIHTPQMAALFCHDLDPEVGDDARAMECKYPNVQFILETILGSLVAFTVEDDTFESLKKSMWAVVSPTDSILAKIPEAETYVSSDSVLCLGTNAQSKATTNVNKADQTFQKAATPNSAIANST